MAKLKAPLLSLGAAGAIGKTLVYFNWKGLNVVREWVVPANPKSDPQKKQRNFLKAAVDLIHAAMQLPEPLADTDKFAYALAGSILPTPRTWFNQAVKMDVDRRIDELTPVVFRAGSTTETSEKLAVEVRTHAAVPTEGIILYGTSKTAMLGREDATVVGTKMSADLTTLASGIKYYWKARVTEPPTLAGAESGIYHGTPD